MHRHRFFVALLPVIMLAAVLGRLRPPARQTRGQMPGDKDRNDSCSGLTAQQRRG